VILHDVVVFDLDGTLVDSAGLWSHATREAIAEVYAKEGIEAPLPTETDLRAVIGTPAPHSLLSLLPPERHRLVAEITEGIRRRGSEAMRGGGPGLYPGAREGLAALKRENCAIAIATNAGRRYRDACLDELGLRPIIDLAYCLDSPGVADKTGMVAAILRELGTRRGVMVGDRSHDREAGHKNGLPFVAFLPGYGSEEEREGAEAQVRDFPELVEVLRGRGKVLEGIAEEVLRRPRARDGALVVGVTGPLGVGKSLFVDDLARLLGARRTAVEIIRLDDFGTAASGAAEARPRGDHLKAAFDLERFLGAVEAARTRRTTGPIEGRAIVLVDGIFLLDPRVRGALDFAIYLDAREEILLRRLGGSRGPEVVRLAREVFLPAHAAFARANPPGRLADLVLENSNPLRPRTLAPGPIP
jgi:phosphoglycolate phosphatase